MSETTSLHNLRISSARGYLALGAVAVVGAGLSIDARLPMTGGLNTLLWEALDSDPSARADVAQELSRPDRPSKHLLGDVWDDVAVGWAAVGASPFARARFQRQIAALDADRSARSSLAHEALARLIHRGIVELVISLNWDTALEHAYQRLYGTNLPTGVLLKPHGDAARPDIRWTLPNEPGIVPSDVLDAVQSIEQKYVRTLLIIGYSERDEVVVKKLIAPLDDSWRTVRIGPSASGPDDIPMGAEIALPRLASDVAKHENEAAWHTVTYQGSRGIDAALKGERLSPSDVDACPPLGEVEIVVEALRSDRAVVLNGPTGSGKSITAYQALRRLTQDGFEILRLRGDARDWGVERWLIDLRLFPWPKVLFIDDAQDLSPDTVRELAERADDTTRVLVAGIDHVAGGVTTLKMSSGSAVTQLAGWVRDQRESVFPMVARLDDQVGSHPRDFFFDNRIDIASREPTAWQFFNTLTGGWRRVQRAVLELRDCDRADLALLLVAVAQIAWVDAGTSRAKLKHFAHELDRGEAWLDKSLRELTSRRLVLDTDGQLRCAHLQNAYAVLSWMLHPPRHPDPLPSFMSSPQVPAIASAPKEVVASRRAKPERPTERSRLSDEDERSDREHACKLVTFALESDDTPLRGLLWLADCGAFARARDVLSRQGVLSPARYHALALCALATPASGNIAAAAQLLAHTISYGYLRDSAMVELIQEHDLQLKEWFSAIAPENAWALGDLANSLHRPSKDIAAQLAAFADPQRLARLVIDGGWTHSTSTGHALDRLCNVGTSAVREAIRPHLDYEAYSQMFDESTEFWRMTSLLADLIYVDHQLALLLLERASPRLARQFIEDPVRRWNEMFHLALHLGFISFGSSKRRHPREVLKPMQAFVKALDQDRLAATISTPSELWGQLNFDQFVAFLFDVEPKVFASVVARVDLDAFEESLQKVAQDPDRTLLIVASALQEIRPAEIHDIFDRLESDLERMDMRFAYVAPDVAIRALRRGLPLDLELSSQNWKTAAEVLERLWASEKAIAREVAQANSDAMCIGFAAKNHGNPWEGLRYWIATCDVVAPYLVDEVIARLPEGAVLGWQRGLRRPKKNERSLRKDVSPLVQRAAQMGGHVGNEARQLLERFPSLAIRGETSTPN